MRVHAADGYPGYMKDENIGTHNSIERLKAPKERFSTYNSNYVNLEKMQINQE